MQLPLQGKPQCLPPPPPVSAQLPQDEPAESQLDTGTHPSYPGTSRETSTSSPTKTGPGTLRDTL